MVQPAQGPVVQTRFHSRSRLIGVTFLSGLGKGRGWYVENKVVQSRVFDRRGIWNY